MAVVALVAAGCAASGTETVSSPGGAEDTADLRAENQRLRERLAHVEVERDEALAKAADLEARLTPAGTSPSAGAPSETAEPEGLDGVGARGLPVVRLSPESEEAPAAADGESEGSTGASVGSHLVRVDAGSDQGASPGGGAATSDSLDLYERALDAYRGGQSRSAVQLFSRFLREHPVHPYADNALYYRGMAEQQSGNVRAAERDFSKVATDYPSEPEAALALLQLARLSESRGDQKAARAAYQTILRDHAGSAAAFEVPSRYRK